MPTIVIGLALGAALVLLSIAGARHWSSRGRSAAEAVRVEASLWAIYLVAAAVIYVGFALREGGRGWMTTELLGVGFYGALAVAGVKLRRGWPIALGWALHAAWDVVVHRDAPEQLVPAWYRWACLAYDVIAAGYLFRRDAAAGVATRHT